VGITHLVSYDVKISELDVKDVRKLNKCLL